MNDPDWLWRQHLAYEYERELQKASNKKNPPVERVRQRAYNAVHRAILNGDLPSLSSQRCVTPNCERKPTMYHHHHGYGPPFDLDVVPMCRRCHASHPPESR